MNQDEIKGKVDQAKARPSRRSAISPIDQQLHDEGVVDEASSEIREGFGKANRQDW